MVSIRVKTVDALGRDSIPPKILQATAKTLKGVEIQPHSFTDPNRLRQYYFEAAGDTRFRPCPGKSSAARACLAGKKIFLTGDDQMSYEVVPQQVTVFFLAPIEA